MATASLAKVPAFRITSFTVWVTILLAVMGMAALGGIVIFWQGLWITNLTNLVPWGLWITVDLSSIALSAGAFSLCAAVYLVGLKQYEPIARTATFIGLIGYTMAMLCLLLDIGRPHLFWHALIYWNTHSLLWEVTMCIVLYLTVLLFESMPIIARWDWLKNHYPTVVRYMSGVHHYAPYLAIAGMCLSMLHQSSLGAAYGVMKARPFWYKPEMAVLFMFSALCGGVSMTLFASMFSARLTKKAIINDELIEKVSYFVAWLLVGYLYFRAWDLLAQTYTYTPGKTEGLGLVASGQLSFNFWVGEMFLGVIVPMIILLTKRWRQDPFIRMVALFLVAAGTVAFRWDTNLSGQLLVMSITPGPVTVSYTSYMPALVEFVTAAGIVAYGLLAFTLGVQYLRLVDHREEAAGH